MFILYCIDAPAPDGTGTTADTILGWLVCSHQMTGISVSGEEGQAIEYGLSRPDVSAHLTGLNAPENCGFRITGGEKPIHTDLPFKLKIQTENTLRETREFDVTLELHQAGIRDIAIGDLDSSTGSQLHDIHQKFESALKKHPWITIRMDIVNKCNLRCIMCHYKEEEIRSRPLKAITAEQLHDQLKDIASYVKHIMLSCGFEPLMSKHFHEILQMLNSSFPHMEIGLCTNAMLLGSEARKSIMENQVTHVLLSLDGVRKETVERIRARANFEKLVGNIMALRDLKQTQNRKYPLLLMDFVLMHSNIDEAPDFVEVCARLGIEMIDFRHMVGNIFFSDHEEMLTHHPEKYNHYRELILAQARKHSIKVRMPEAFETAGKFNPEGEPLAGLADFNKVVSDIQSLEVRLVGDPSPWGGNEKDFTFLKDVSCLRPFNEIMITDDDKILPCSYYHDSMGLPDENTTLYDIYFGAKFTRVREKMLLGEFDHNCISCPIRMKLLPTDVVK